MIALHSLADHDQAVTIAHLGMREIAVLVLDDHLELEAERLAAATQAPAGVQIGKRGNDGGTNRQHWALR